MISVVIPAYRRPEATLRLLGDVHRQAGCAFEVIVVDDHSPENPASLITGAFPTVRWLQNPANAGPAAARNRGIRAARGDLIVGFDNDVTVPDPDTLRKTAAIFAREPGVDGIAFRILLPDGTGDDQARWWHPRPIRECAALRFPTSYFSGTAYAFRREAMIAAGLFPEILFMHYEEVELAYRVLDRGGTIQYRPELVVRHHEHPVARRGKVRSFYKPRNQVLLALGCLPPARALGYLAPRLALGLLRAFRTAEPLVFFGAMRSAIALAPQRRRERRVLQPATFRRLAALRAGRDPEPEPGAWNADATLPARATTP